MLWWYRYKHLGFKLRFTVFPNTCGPGLAIFHTGDFIFIKPSAKIGRNCTLRPGVVIGQKRTGEEGQPVTIGDNVDFSIGVKVFGSLNSATMLPLVQMPLYPMTFQTMQLQEEYLQKL